MLPEPLHLRPPDVTVPEEVTGPSSRPEADAPMSINHPTPAEAECGQGGPASASGYRPPEPLRLQTLEQFLALLVERLEPGPEPLLIDARQLAELLAVSAATLARMKASGKLPAPVVLGAGCHRWRLDEIRRWAASGCPDRPSWKAQQAARTRA
jgi:predicted DNA-binding transcriptional regulator AlpA